MTTNFFLSLSHLVLAAIYVSLTSTLVAQKPNGDPCSAALVQQVDFYALDDQSAMAYLSQIDETTWDSKKTDAGFIGKWTGFLGPMSGDFSYQKFDEARRQFFQRVKDHASAATSIKKLRQYLTDAQLDAWKVCITQQGRSGLFLTEKSVNDDMATFELLWVRPPTGASEVTISSSTVTGGRAVDPQVPPGLVFKKGERVQGSKVFTVSREPSKALNVTINTGEMGVTDTIESSRILALESHTRVLQNKLDEASTKITAVTKTLTETQTALQTAPHGALPVDGGNAVTSLCPPGSYMIGARFQIDKGGPHGIISNILPVCKPVLPPQIVRQP